MDSFPDKPVLTSKRRLSLSDRIGYVASVNLGNAYYIENKLLIFVAFVSMVFLLVAIFAVDPKEIVYYSAAFAGILLSLVMLPGLFVSLFWDQEKIKVLMERGEQKNKEALFRLSKDTGFSKRAIRWGLVIGLVLYGTILFLRYWSESTYEWLSVFFVYTVALTTVEIFITRLLLIFKLR